MSWHLVQIANISCLCLGNMHWRLGKKPKNLDFLNNSFLFGGLDCQRTTMLKYHAIFLRCLIILIQFCLASYFQGDCNTHANC